MSTNAETTETKEETKKFKQMRDETRTFSTFEEADACRISIKGILKENQKVRVKYRRSTKQYDVVTFVR